VTSNKRLVWCL